MTIPIISIVVGALSLALPIEVMYCDTSLHYLGVVDRDGQNVLVRGNAGPLGRQPDRVKLTSRVFSLDAGEERILQQSLLSSPISWRSADYWFRPQDVAGSVPFCGTVRVGGDRVVACGIGAPASGEQSSGSVRAGQLIRTLDGFGRDDALAVNPDWTSAVLKKSLLSVLDATAEAPLKGAPTDREQDAVATDTLRACVAETLVHGRLLDKPLESPVTEVRMAGVSSYGAKLPDQEAYHALAQALGDSAMQVRVAAASELAPYVSVDNAQLLRRLQRVACDAQGEPLNSHLRAILKAKGAAPECATRTGK